MSITMGLLWTAIVLTPTTILLAASAPLADEWKRPLSASAVLSGAASVFFYLSAIWMDVQW